MSKVYRVYHVNAFTKEISGGNPAGVVSNADGLTVEQMQLIAKKLNYSETAFILTPPKNAKYNLLIRYFTPKTEVPICGHATIAGHYTWAIENKLHAGIISQKSQVAIHEIEYVKKDDGDYRIIMTQGEFGLGEIIEGNRRVKFLDALGLNETDLDERCKIQVASTGHSKVMIGIKSREILNDIEPDLSGLVGLSKEIFNDGKNVNGYFVFTLDSDDDSYTHGRMFAPAIGINEDPVTGNANGPLGGYLYKYRLISENLFNKDKTSFSFKAKQGTKIGREGIVYVMVDINNSSVRRVRIAGDAVVVRKEEMEL